MERLGTASLGDEMGSAPENSTHHMNPGPFGHVTTQPEQPEIAQPNLCAASHAEEDPSEDSSGLISRMSVL